tara:strand:+ start:618 stop:896 length:279 start_codon:yes stop_codon:yes gene_type:complete
MNKDFDTHKWFKNQYLSEGDLNNVDYLDGMNVESAVQAYITKSLKAIEQYQNNLSPMGDEVEIDYNEVIKHLREAFKAFDRVDYSSINEFNK